MFLLQQFLDRAGIITSPPCTLHCTVLIFFRELKLATKQGGEGWSNYYVEIPRAEEQTCRDTEAADRKSRVRQHTCRDTEAADKKSRVMQQTRRAE